MIGSQSGKPPDNRWTAGRRGGFKGVGARRPAGPNGPTTRDVRGGVALINSLRIVRHVPAGEGVSTAMASVTFDKATRLYPGSTRPAVDQIELEVADGEFLVLV